MEESRIEWLHNYASYLRRRNEKRRTRKLFCLAILAYALAVGVVVWFSMVAFHG